ncbi:hypothetical protein FQN55_001238 [Onygenales sp. PD_40]|nr:hypothetical protein FQN55_001238 [Onygenales sp. PD_40]KAK2790410.1 hypothetical protein FQN53_009433 [Emmonsiellopsis sp. PD_33]KAK2792752.1 hypothetical protein FQN52_002814 [Onygenales sp. PD_12]KAK2803249.1 hypothetical protein FQN51_003666 [Onygenales sp. PD_10]
MVSSPDNERAEQLAREAVELVDAGHREAASRNLREAISLAPHNDAIKAAFNRIREDEETTHPLVNLCRRYAARHNDDAGREAAAYLRSDGLQPPPEVALDCLKLILDRPAASLSDTQDQIISGLVRHSSHVQRYFAAQLQISVTQFFDEIYDRGDDAVVCLDTVVLDTALWQSEKVRSHCESELFQLFIAKLMESGHDLDGRSLKGISRLLAVDADSLQHLVDEDGFDVILSSLDLRLPADVRSQATLATAKYLEAAKEDGQKLFSNFLTARIARQRNDDFVIAFSAAAAVFPIIPAMTATLFLTDGFIQSLVPLLDRKRKGSMVERAVLELFNAACIDKQCREAIDKYCGEWLSDTLTNGTDDSSELAAVILAKIRASENGTEKPGSRVQEESGSSHDLVERFKNLLAKRPQDGDFHHPIEGLAYSSIKPDVKEQLSAKGSTFPSDLIAIMKKNTKDSSLIYGGLMVIWNLTKYRPNLSEEQKKISELRAYANVSTSKPTGPDPLDDDDHVRERCIAVIDAGVMPLLIECSKANTGSVQDLTCKILLALSKYPKTRGKLAQQGAVKLLLSILNTHPTTSPTERAQTAAHALARILISVNPAHIFPATGFPQITSAIRPLLTLLTPHQSTTTQQPNPAPLSMDTPLDLLPTFESLLALTNLASSPDPTAPTTITRLAFDTIYDNLLLSSHTYIQRAATELLCNLTTCPQGIAKFADGSPRAANRLHVLLALADVEDGPTRRAAGGALAMLTEYESVVEAVVGRRGGVGVLVGFCRGGKAPATDENGDGDGGEAGEGEGEEGERPSEEMVHRGLVCIRNMVYADGRVGERAREVLRGLGAVEVLKKCLLEGGYGEGVLRVGVEAVQGLVGS